jgi:hypothetical protein
MAIVLRLGAVVAALVVVGWFALGIRQANGISQATGLVTGASHLTAVQAARARSALDTAATLNPDRTVDILRGQLALDRGRSAEAQRILLAVTREEPQNLTAWIQLAYAAARNHHDRLLALTGRRISALFPEVH